VATTTQAEVLQQQVSTPPERVHVYPRTRINMLAHYFIHIPRMQECCRLAMLSSAQHQQPDEEFSHVIFSDDHCRAMQGHALKFNKDGHLLKGHHIRLYTQQQQDQMCVFQIRFVAGESSILFSSVL
jgi:hypothetical protein